MLEITEDTGSGGFSFSTMKLIPLRGKYGAGKFAMVDDEDYELVSKFKWHVHKDGYAIRSFWVNGKCLKQYMHRLVMGALPGQEIDHWDMNPLNCQKYNLRSCLHAENGRNRKRQSNNTSGFKGVSWDKSTLLYAAQIAAGGKRLWIGRYSTAMEASLAYRAAAKRIHKEFANW